jgi:hypothetical protein
VCRATDPWKKAEPGTGGDGSIGVGELVRSLRNGPAVGAHRRAAREDLVLRNEPLNPIITSTGSPANPSRIVMTHRSVRRRCRACRTPAGAPRAWRPSCQPAGRVARLALPSASCAVTMVGKYRCTGGPTVPPADGGARPAACQCRRAPSAAARTPSSPSTTPWEWVASARWSVAATRGTARRPTADRDRREELQTHSCRLVPDDGTRCAGDIVTRINGRSRQWDHRHEPRRAPELGRVLDSHALRFRGAGGIVTRAITLSGVTDRFGLPDGDTPRGAPGTGLAAAERDRSARAAFSSSFPVASAGSVPRKSRGRPAYEAC